MLSARALKPPFVPSNFAESSCPCVLRPACFASSRSRRRRGHGDEGGQSCRALSSGPSANNPSFDSEDDLDRNLAEELDRLVHPEKMQQVARHLELMWKIGAAKRRDLPSPCSCCSGTGETECQWCHGTGVLMVGDQVMCSTTDHGSKCPVCNSTGYTKCEKCVGTGFRAKWLGDAMPGKQS